MKVIQPQWLKSGGQMSPGFVPKMTKGTTSGGVGNPVIDGFDQSVYDDELEKVFIRDMQKAKTLEEKQALIQRYHDLAGNAYDLLRDIGYDDAASTDSAIRDTRGGKQKSPTFNYQRAYHAAGFHTPHFTSGFKVGNYTPVKGGTGDNQYSSNNTKFMGDDIYGRITFHRVYNRFTDDQLARHNASANKYGFQWVLDERGASDPRQKDGFKFYRLELMSNPGQEVTEEDIIDRGAEEIIQENTSPNLSEEITEEGSTEETSGGNGGTTATGFTGNDLDFTVNRKAPIDRLFITYPLEYGALAANQILGARRSTDWMNKSQLPLKGYPWQFYKPGSDFAGNQLYNKAADQAYAEGRKLSNNTADMTQGLGAALTMAGHVNDKIAPAKAQNTTARYNADMQTTSQVDFGNASRAMEAWNANRAAATLEGNNIVANEAKYQERKTAAVDSAMSKTIADTHKLILDKHLNDIKALYAEHEIGRDEAIMGLLQAWINWQAHPEQSNAFASFYRLLQQGSASPIVQELQKEGVVIDASKNLLDQALQIWNDPGKTSIQAYRSAYDREARAYYEQVMYSLNEVKTDFKRNIAGIPDRVSNLPYFSELGLGTHNYDRTSPVYGMLFAKQGGKVERFYDYARLIQRQQSDYSKQEERTTKRIYSDLNKQLDRISREELALLRAVFK